MLKVIVVAIAAVVCSPAFAQKCDAGSTLAFQCGFKSGKQVAVCANASSATYNFGKPGAKPEMSLKTPLAKLEYLSQGGNGMDNLLLLFKNGKTHYEINYVNAFSRLDDQGNQKTKGFEEATLEVRNGSRTLATLPCIEKSIKANFDAIRKDPTM